MQTATTPDVQTTPPQAPPDKPANGAGSPEHLAALPTDLLHQNEELARNWAAVQKIGRMVAAKTAEVSKQNTECAKIKANLDDEREILHKLEREQKELQEELTQLATGRASERLPFKEPADKAAKSDAPASADDWKAMTLEMLGIKTKRVLTALHDHEPPIVTFGDLAVWQQKKGDFWAKDIKKLGDKGREEIENAQAAYWAKNPQPKAEASSAAAAEACGDAEILPASEESIVNNPSSLHMRIAQRRGGRWAVCYGCSFGGKKFKAAKKVIGKAGKFTGNFTSRHEAIAAGCLEVDDAILSITSGKGSKKLKDDALEVRKILNRIDEQLAAEGPESAKTVAEGLPSPESQGAYDAAVTEKDQTARRARKGK